jgi:hypothetical protein
MSERRRQVEDGLALAKAIGPMLAGKDQHVQATALADLLATFLAGHVVLGDPKATEALRLDMLAMHMDAVKALIDLNYKISVEPQIKARTQ